MTAGRRSSRRLVGAGSIVCIATPMLLAMAPQASATAVGEVERPTSTTSLVAAPALADAHSVAAESASMDSKGAAVRALAAVRTTPGAAAAKDVGTARGRLAAVLRKADSTRIHEGELRSFSQQARISRDAARPRSIWAGLHDARTDRELTSATATLDTALARVRAAAESRHRVAEAKRTAKVAAAATRKKTADRKQQAAAAAKKRSQQRARQMRQWAGATAGYSNGKTPLSKLCRIDWKPTEYLRCDALVDLRAMNQSFRKAFGTNIVVVDGYRSYSEQVAVKSSRGSFAATPGTSNHGKAVALDLGGGINVWGSAQRRWLEKHASAFGWKHPDWMRKQHYEPWHWEYQRHR